MKYTVTKQFSRSNEILIAQFIEWSDAKIFLSKTAAEDDREGKKRIYRVYDDSGLLHEYNKEHISVTYARYAEGDYDFSNNIVLLFQVLIKRNGIEERNIIANFNDKSDAMLFIMGKCDSDNLLDENDLLFLYKARILIATFSKNIIANQKKMGVNAGGQGTEATFRPTPLSTKLLPPGGPGDCWVEKEDEQK